MVNVGALDQLQGLNGMGWRPGEDGRLLTDGVNLDARSRRLNNIAA
jgi:hypothetical protein